MFEVTLTLKAPDIDYLVAAVKIVQKATGDAFHQDIAYEVTVGSYEEDED